METFKEKLRINLIINGIATIVLAVFALLGFMSEGGLIHLVPAVGDSRWQSVWRGFISGASCALLLMMVFGLARGIRALHNEKELKKLYVKENDERAIQIWTYARAAAFQTFLILGMVSIVVAGYFSMTVSITILACVWCSSIIGLLFKIYYNKKF